MFMLYAVFRYLLFYFYLWKIIKFLSVLFFFYLKTKTFGGGGGGARSNLNMGAVSHRNREVLPKERPSKSESKHEGVYRELVSMAVSHRQIYYALNILSLSSDVIFFAFLLRCYVNYVSYSRWEVYNFPIFYHEN